MNSNATKTRRRVRCILFHHKKSNLVHDVDLLGYDVLGAQHYVIGASFTRRRVVEFVHVFLKVFQPGACSHSGREELQLTFRILQHYFSVNNRFMCHVTQCSTLDDLLQCDAEKWLYEKRMCDA